MIGLSSIFSPEPDQRGNGEPGWMPSEEEVTRARAQMEREGVVRSISRGQRAAGEELVPPGETPWLWLAAAALWVVLWPAIISLKIGSGRFSWLPWWLPVLLAAGHMLALAGPVWYSSRSADKEDIRRRFGRVRTIAQMLALDPIEFEAWSGMLFLLMGYWVRNTQYVADHGIDLLVGNPKVRHGLVQCKRYRGTVGEPTVRDLYGTMMHEQADAGWLVTSGGISRQATEWAAGKPIQLWDGQMLVELARKYG